MRTASPLRAALAAAALSSLVACTSAPEYPPGAGLRAFDRRPPEGAETHFCPEWTEGDELVYRRGTRIEVSYVVEREGEGWALHDPRSETKLVLDADLAQLGVRPSDGDPGEYDVRFDPFDPSYSWPLWVGKRWTGQYVRREGSSTEVPVIARYEVDASEEVTVPAGTFMTLRIYRRDAVDLPGNYVERTTVDWYAPEVGYVVKRLEGGLETVLVERLTQGARSEPTAGE